MELTEEDIIRFWKGVERKGEEECWEWKRCKFSNGYGRIKIKGHISTHRLALFLTTGIWGEMALHSCDNPSCCNPNHLRWGTHKENMRDMTGRGRHHLTKLTSEQVLKIRAKYALGNITQQALADEYNVKQAAISDIIRRITWTHI